MFPLHPITPHYIPLHPIIYPIGSMYAIYGNIYHQYTPFMLAYIPYMDPMGYIYIYIPLYPQEIPTAEVTFSSFPRSCWKCISMCVMDCYGARHCAVETLGRAASTGGFSSWIHGIHMDSMGSLHRWYRCTWLVVSSFFLIFHNI